MKIIIRDFLLVIKPYLLQKLLRIKIIIISIEQMISYRNIKNLYKYRKIYYLSENFYFIIKENL
jgi:hypothetical protein